MNRARVGDLAANLDSRRVPLSSRERAERRGRYPYYGAAGQIDSVDGFLFEGLHLLIGEDGSVVHDDGSPFLQLVGGRFWVNNHAHVLRAQDDLDTRFLYYALRNAEITGLVTGAVQPKLTQANLNSISVPFPPRQQRRDIVEILGAIDDKIELNRRTNETLEAMARAIFQSWFVDFDPVRAKMDGRQPEGMDAETAKLFPASFDSAGRPAGWRALTVGEVCERVAMGPFGSSIKVSTFVEHGVPVISGQHLHGPFLSDRDFRFVSEEHASQLRNANVGPGDLLFTHAGSIGQVSLMPYETAHRRYVISQRQFYVRPDPRTLSGEWLMFYFRSPAGQHRLLANASSTGVPSLAQPVTYLRGLGLVVPPQKIDAAFVSAVRPSLRAALRAEGESRCLASLRDTLLPKLLSGELRVPDAERAVANAV